MKLLFIPLLFSCLFFGLTTRGQSLTEKDFRLMIDGKLYSDSINSISVSELLKLKEVTANFSWIVVKSITVYCDFVKPEDRDHVYDGVEVRRCHNNIICKEAKDLIKTMTSGLHVGIVAEAINKQGKTVHIKDIVYRIK
ncbi:hypothetical protein [Lacibacter sediminis]|uniref:Gliding motility-associated protein GldM C-terminal domain-containing protein n=1 Tax=Lacibacter sediminis TaxID=2760713 RepID=A0A7G5XIK6_9BACT|nr:hypothetical protein [Lacibacter sediminis]QNA45309.1 hypothetical protein H4075_03645 [Lacibacter sediminis]